MVDQDPIKREADERKVVMLGRACSRHGIAVAISNSAEATDAPNPSCITFYPLHQAERRTSQMKPLTHASMLVFLS